MEEKEIKIGRVAFKCIVMTFVWTAIIYGLGYGAFLGIKYLAENFTMEQVMPWVILVGIFVMCAAAQMDNYDREVYPEKYLEDNEE